MNTKKILTFVFIVLLLLVVAYSFVPQVLTGKVVNQQDITGYIGMSHEATSWDTAHPDDKTAWTDAMFGGMPTTMITGNPEGDWTKGIYKIFMFGRRPGSYLFISLLGAFLLMLSLGINWILALGGAVAITFCSYNPQIIQVGHNTKMQAIAWLPWVLAAVIFTYKTALGEYRSCHSEQSEEPTKEREERKLVFFPERQGRKTTEGRSPTDSKKNRKWLPLTILGAALFGFALNFEIKANHVQITYYLAIIIFCYALVELIRILVKKDERHLVGRFAAASALMLVLGCAGIATNADKLIPTYLYTQETMRGGSELATEGEGETTSTGLDLDYATSWSYGWNELPNMLIPNFNGGSSAGALSMNSETMTLLRNSGQTNLKQISKALPLYWGPQPFTAGPMYMGAITIFLFILGLLLYKGSDKWWMIIATLIAICLGVGYHFMPFTKFWFYHVPFYNKFRTVSMALIILQFTLPMLGFLVLDRIFKGQYAKEEVSKQSLVALAITGGFCLICALIPSIAGDFTSSSDAGMAPQLAEALQDDRKSLLRTDAWVSLLMIALTYVLVMWGFSTPKSDGKPSGSPAWSSRKVGAAAAVVLLVLINMFSVGKRYLNSDHFTTERQFKSQFTARAVDKTILEDKDVSYRVLDLTANPFNDSFTSYFHKNVGGYSPVKLQRYQDLIDRHLMPELNSVIGALNKSKTYADIEENMPSTPALSMLNDKYIIVGADAAPVVNSAAMGNCWFVDSVAVAATPEDEIGMIDEVDLSTTAIIGKDFSDAASAVKAGSDSTDAISLVSYAPNALTYKYRSSSPRTAIFSEVYYPRGWKATLEDGTAVDLFRANWILRAANLPAGEHELTMRFAPESYRIGSAISRISSAILILLVLTAICGMAIPRKKEQLI